MAIDLSKGPPESWKRTVKKILEKDKWWNDFLKAFANAMKKTKPKE